MNSPDRLPAWAGQLHVTPGPGPGPALHSTRRDWSPALSRGKPANELPSLLSAVFNLCGQAHRLCSQLALQAAGAERPVDSAARLQALQHETAQEHVRRIGLDWPRQLGDRRDALLMAQATEALTRCPVLRPVEQVQRWPAMRQWLAQELLHMPADEWLHAWQEDRRAGGRAWLNTWVHQSSGWLARLLRQAQPDDLPLNLAAARRMAPPTIQTDLSMLATQLQQPGYTMAPTWHGDCGHTGTWTRHHDDQTTPSCAWTLLGARLAELIRLSLPDAPGHSGTGWLSMGMVSLPDHAGLAWVEMARGLLIHWVRLSDHTPHLVEDCHVLAPTEWNFHPQGVVAQALRALHGPAPRTGRQIRLLMSALDPCVPYEVTKPCAHTEVSHA